MSSKNQFLYRRLSEENLEGQAGKEKQKRIEAKFIMLQEEGWRLTEAFHDMEIDFWDVPFLMYELYKEGMTPEVESALREKAEILGNGVDEMLYESAMWEVESEDRISADEKTNKT